MKNKYILLVGFLFCSLRLFAQTEYTVSLYDTQRGRIIPVAIYEPKHVNKHTPVIIFNHGYGQNAPDSYISYSCLTKPLAMKGYYVVSIQHELPNDLPLAMSGNFMETRMPNWERGVENILFTIKEFKKLKPKLSWKNITIMGHSNGGDMAILFATKYPTIAKKIISLDHRRMVIPRCCSPQIYTLRGSDYEADENVIPTVEEQQKHHISIIQLNDIKHGDMDNKGKREQHDTILHYLYKFLK